MKAKLKYLVALMAMTSSMSCSSSDYQVDGNVVSIVKDDMTTQITVMNDEIIRVNKRLNDGYTPRIEEYVVEMTPEEVEWTIENDRDAIYIATDALKVTYNRKDGEISYTTLTGENIVSEIAGGSYIKAVREGDYEMQQRFTVGDEGIFGLGQFQNNIMNYRNTPVRLQQCNVEIAIPFFFSTAGYGIFWNNYSITDFNRPDFKLDLPVVVDKKKNIRKGTFTPRKTGMHYFLLESKTPGQENRGYCWTDLIIGGDTVVKFNLPRTPDSFSGRKYLEAGVCYEVWCQDTGARDVTTLYYSEPDYNRTQFTNEHGEAIDYYLIAGDTPASILSSYGTLTGKSPMLPKSAYGFWQSKNRYDTQEDILYHAHEFRRRGIPIDNIVQDWHYWPNRRKCPFWDRTRYPEPKEMVDEIHDLNMNLTVSVWPNVENDTLVKRYNLDLMKDITFINGFEPKVTQGFYRALSDSMYKIGVDAIWLDGSEPIIETHPDYESGHGEFQQLANVYSQRVTKAMYEGFRAEFPDKRAATLSRSAYPGQQRYATLLWSGDIDGSWEELRRQIPAGLNLAAAGMPYWSTDIGGFFREKRMMRRVKGTYDQYTDANYIELLTRWFQYGTFCSIFRTHGSAAETEIWNYGAEFESVARKYLDLRYQLMPYIYSEAHKVTTSGEVIMSPLAYHFPKDKNLWENRDEFLFGESILVAPVVEAGQRERELYLPSGEKWYNLWDDTLYLGGRKIVTSAELDELPLFVKAGSIIPYGPKIQYVSEPSDELTIIKIYPGKDASFTLYQDDGTSYKYEEGTYSLIKFEYDEENSTLAVTTPHDKYVDFENNPQSFKVVVATQDVEREIVFDGERITLKL